MTTRTLSTHAGVPEPRYAMAADRQQIDRTANALAAHGFTVEVLDSTQEARTRVAALLPVGAAVYTAASETLRLSGIEDDINGSDRFMAIKPRVWALDRQTHGDEIRRLMATPGFVVGSVSAVTEDGALVAVSASGSQLPAYAGGASKVIWVVGAQKIVPDLAGLYTASRRTPIRSRMCGPAQFTGDPAPSTR